MTASIQLLKKGFEAAVTAAQAQTQLPAFLPNPPKGRTLVIGMGKAGAAMVQTFEQHWRGNWQMVEGLVAVPYGSALPTQHIPLIECAHPIPDHNSVAAAKKMLSLVQGLTTDDLVVCLLSGGGSALVSLPAAGLDLATKQPIIQQLLHSGASIHEINIVRRHLSAIKGGHLAAACYPAQVVNLIISDVPGDEPASIASGPTVVDTSSCHDALQILTHYHISLPAHLHTALQSSLWESIKPNHPIAPHIQTHLIATPQRSLTAAAGLFEQAGFPTLLLGDCIEGEAKEVAKVMAGIAQSILKHQTPISSPCVLLSGGETSVRVTGSGVGGRNVEFLLALLCAVQNHIPLSALAADTDGVDGALEVAGAYITPSTWNKALALKLDPTDFLRRNDAHSFFQVLQQQLITGPTQTNVNDFRALLLTPFPA